MKIAIYSTQVIPSNSDLDSYGGLELIAGLQAKYFVEQGHEVHLFACMDSYFSKDKQTNQKPPGQENGHLYAFGPKGTNPAQAWVSYWKEERSKQVLKDCDIVCDHSWGWYPYSVYNELKNICHVNHGPTPNLTSRPPMEKPNLICVGFRHAALMAKASTGTTWRAVQNGIPLWKYTMNNKPIAERERILWLSRIYYPKGAHRAIEIADSLKMPIDIVGGSFGDEYGPGREYVQKIKDMCQKSQYATFHGEVSFEKKVEFYQNAKCVILPIEEYNLDTRYVSPQALAWGEWHEPFGLITPESNACGTPVIVTPNGGWMESMIHGYNGFFANSNKEFEYFIRQVDNLRPEYCRKNAERFDYKSMGQNYLNLFNEIVYNNNSW